MTDCALCRKYLAYETPAVRARIHREFHAKQK